MERKIWWRAFCLENSLTLGAPTFTPFGILVVLSKVKDTELEKCFCGNIKKYNGTKMANDKFKAGIQSSWVKKGLNYSKKEGQNKSKKHNFVKSFEVLAHRLCLSKR